MNTPTDADAIRLSRIFLTLQSSAGPVNVLNGVDLAVRRGDSVGIMGPSGAGKTSLLMVASGLERPTSGSVTIADKRLDTMDETGLARFRGAHVGIVFQSFHLIGSMTALENVALPLELARRGNVDDNMRTAAESLAAVGLKERMDHYPGQLSGGEQQRVALARAFAPGPEILLADEPTGNLDETTGDMVMDLIFTLAAARNTTMVLVTHNPSLAARCTRRLRMAGGHLEEATETAA
ncbi:MAG: ABC transporter ATP-binding protein [Desulfovibrio sp.]|uniref:ABC transporter ATP-binding protein n=1 Tax=Desulfovibrio sp. 7SRBS1 TaxID=3378064 RepID=UPI003B420FA1